jgi:hypothetical protein
VTLEAQLADLTRRKNIIDEMGLRVEYLMLGIRVICGARDPLAPPNFDLVPFAWGYIRLAEHGECPHRPGGYLI